MSITQNSQLFSRQDVELLKEAPNDEIKINLLKKLHENFKLGYLKESEHLVAEEILRQLANDISIRIRQHVANKFCDNLALPHDIAITLANDLEDIVAIPIIQNSLVLNDADLIKIIKNGNIQRQKTISCRRQLSPELCDHIVTQAAPQAIERLIANRHVNLTHKQSEWLVASHLTNTSIMRALIINKKIDPEQAYELLAKVSEDLQKMLIIGYNIPKNVVNNIVHDSKEWMIMNLILSHSEKRNDVSLKQIIDNLAVTNELTFSLLIKSLSLGDLTFFEAVLARLADIPPANAHKLIWSEDITTFKALYEKCKLPAAMLQAVYKLALIAKTESNANPQSDKIYHRIFSALNTAADKKEVSKLDYLVTIAGFSLRQANLL